MFEIGIVGLGAWGRKIVASVQGKSDRVRFVRAATRTPARAATFASGNDLALGHCARNQNLLR